MIGIRNFGSWFILFDFVVNRKYGGMLVFKVLDRFGVNEIVAFVGYRIILVFFRLDLCRGS